MFVECYSHVTVNTAILTGGLSRRFGSPKTDIEIDGETLLARTARIARDAGAAEVQSIDVDLRPGNGPLGGIETALSRGSSSHVMILACDMPGLTAPLLRLLWTHPAPHDVVVPASGGRRHPLCARWARSALGSVSAAIDRGDLSVQRLLDALEISVVDEVALREGGIDPAAALKNVNRLEDLR